MISVLCRNVIRLCQQPLQLISRSKIVARRKKIQLKKLPVSPKKFQQLKRVKSRQQLQKELEVRQRIDHRPNINRNINELIEQLYFPDLRKQDPEAAESSFRVEHLEAEAEMEKLVASSNLNRQLNSDMNSQLLQCYVNHKHELEVGQLVRLVRNIGRNTLNIEQVKKRRLQQWEKHVQKLKAKNIPVGEVLRFMEARDVERHATWKELLTDITEQVTKASNQQLQQYGQLALTMITVFGGVPQDYFTAIFNRASQQPLANFDLHTKTTLLKLLCRDSKVKLTSSVSVAALTQQRQQLKKFGSLLVRNILKDSSLIDVRCLIALVDSVRLYRQPFLNRKQLVGLASTVLRNLALLEFEKVVDVLCLYHRLDACSGEFAELLKFDVMRKLKAYRKFKAVMEVLRLIQRGKIKFGQFELAAGDLLPELSETIVAELRQHKLDGKMLLDVLDGMLFNGWRELGIYDMLAVQLIRREKEISLNDLFHAIFKLTIAGVESPQLRDIGFSRASKQYSRELKRLEDERVKYLPNSTSSFSEYAPSKESKEEVGLQQSLILFLWAYLKQAKTDSELDLDRLLLLLPKEVLSEHLLIYELTRYIQRRLERFRMFPKLHLKPYESKASPALNLYYAVRNYPQKEQDHLLQIEAKLSGMFYKNFSKELNLFLKMPWSDETAVDGHKYLLWLKTATETQLLFGQPAKEDKELLETLLNRRKRLISQQPQSPPSPTTKKADQYELSDEQN